MTDGGDVSAVMVRGISSKISEDTLENFFENRKRSGGGPIQDIVFDKRVGGALIQFQGENVAERILQHGHLKISNIKLEATKATTKEVELFRILLVENLPSGVTEENIILFFESRRCNGGDVETVRLDLNSRKAAVTFAESSVARRVLHHQNLVLNQTVLRVSRCLTDPSILETLSTCEEYEPLSCAIVISGAEEISEQVILLYFENQSRSGGGNVLDVYKHPKDGKYTVTFDEAKVISRVLKGEHVLERKILAVKHLFPQITANPPPPGMLDPLRIVIKGLSRHIECDYLVHCLQDITKCTVHSVIHAVDPTMVIAHFEQPPDFGDLVTHCGKYPFKGEFLIPEQVPLSLKIQLHGSEGLSMEKITMYFESTKRSGGCDKVKLFHDTEKCYPHLICPDIEVRERIVRKHHVIAAQSLYLLVSDEFLEMLPPDLQENGPVWIPEDVSFPITQANVLKFLQNSTKSQEELNTALKDVNAIIDWSSSHETLVVNCLISVVHQETIYVLSAWNESVKKVLEAFIRKIKTYEHLVHSNVWEPSKKKVRGFQSPESAEIFCDDEKRLITVTGFEDQACALFREVKEMCEIEAETTERSHSLTEEAIPLPLLQLRYLKARKFQIDITETMPKLVVAFLEDEGTLKFEGLQSEIDMAQLKMFKMLQPLKNLNMECSASEINLLSYKETMDHMVSLLETEKISAGWRVESKHLAVCATSQDDVERAVTLIRSEMVGEQIKLSAEAQNLLQTQIWKDFEGAVLKKYHGLLTINISFANAAMDLVCVKTLQEGCFTEVKSFLENNVIVAKAIKGPAAVIKALTTVWKSKLTDIEESLQQYQVCISECDDCHLQVKGSNEGILQTEMGLLTLFSSMTIRSCAISDIKCFQTKFGKWALEGVQSRYNVFVKEHTEQDVVELVVCGSCDSEVVAAVESIQDMFEEVLEKDEEITQFLQEKETSIQKLQKNVLAVENQQSPRVHGTNVTSGKRVKSYKLHMGDSKLNASPNPTHQLIHQQILDSKICLQVCEGDIAVMDVGAIVNAANVRLLHGGGVARAISSAAGPQLERECRAYIAKNGSLKVGEVVATNGGNLKSPLVFHAVGPMWNDYANKLHCSQLLMLAFHNCFKLAEDLKVTSIAVPAISSGIFGVPKLIVAKAMYDAAMEFSTTTKKKGYVKKITYVTIDPEMNKTIKLAFEKEGRLDTGLNTGSSSTSNPQVPMGHPARGTNKLINASADDKSAENPVVVPARPGRAGTNHAHTIQNSMHLSAEAAGTAVQYYNTRDFLAGGQAYGNLHRLHSYEEEGMDTVDGDYPSETGNIFGAVKVKHVNGDLGLTRDQSSVGARQKVADGIHKAAVSKYTEHEINDKDDDCALCLDTITNKKTLDKCKHSFCQGCINESFRVQGPKCPLCGELYGVVIGNQPKDGRITVTKDHSISLPGYEQFGTYIIEYYFPDGLQMGEHPYPGKYYQGTYRKAYLPGNKEGKELLKLLEKAFENRQTFTVGRSNTTRWDSKVVWNDIHHKTSTHGGPQACGYPDPDYLNRLRDELAAKGIK